MKRVEYSGELETSFTVRHVTTPWVGVSIDIEVTWGDWKHTTNCTISKLVTDQPTGFETALRQALLRATQEAGSKLLIHMLTLPELRSDVEAWVKSGATNEEGMVTSLLPMCLEEAELCSEDSPIAAWSD